MTWQTLNYRLSSSLYDPATDPGLRAASVFQTMSPGAVSYPPHFSELAPFLPLFQSGLPILIYHKISPPPWRARLRGLYLSPKLFGQQLAQLSAAGFRTSELRPERLREDNRARDIVLSFDDGYRSVFESALPLLKERRLHALLFLVSGHLGGRNEWDIARGEIPEPLMDAAQIREWLQEGNAIGAHTVSHACLPELSAAQAKEEITASKKSLEDQFGMQVDHFCYPYGAWDPKSLELVMNAGFQTACTTEFGVNDAGTNRWLLRRFTARYPSRNLRRVWKIGAVLFSRKRHDGKA